MRARSVGWVEKPSIHEPATVNEIRGRSQLIEAGLVFENNIDTLLAVFLELPQPLRPSIFSDEERASRRGERGELNDSVRFRDFVAKNDAGFFLFGDNVTYSVRLCDGMRSCCDCFLEVSPELVEQLLTCLASARPLFGYACEREEYESRNRVVVKFGDSTVEAWVGRDTNKYVPGLYWLTLISETLANEHGLSLTRVERISAKHIVPAQGMHLFRLYDAPSAWKANDSVSRFCSEVPGVFDIKVVKEAIAIPSDFQDLKERLKEWR